MSTVMIDNLLIDLSNVNNWIGEKYISLRGACAPPSAASRDAIALLISKGVSVFTN